MFASPILFVFGSKHVRKTGDKCLLLTYISQKDYQIKILYDSIVLNILARKIDGKNCVFFGHNGYQLPYLGLEHKPKVNI